VLSVAAAAGFWRRWANIGHRGLAAAALVAVAVLPMAWPFHVLLVSLTPLAVLLVAAAGLSLVRCTLDVNGGAVPPSPPRGECCRASAAAG
jgi:hypothetical protein